jgi:prepilin-type N-terminal cleavage/methylation domain-containing protein
MIRTARPAGFRRPSALSGRRQRRGFTLLELILVLTVVVTLASLSWPRLTRFLKQQSVQGNAEQVRQLLDRARIRAVEEGRPLQVRYEPHGRHFVLLPLDPVDPNGTPAATTTTIRQPTTAGEPFRVYELSEDCQFHIDSSLLTGEQTVIEQLGDAWLNHLENGLLARTVGWSAPIVYYPDGSSTDGLLTVMDQSRRYVKLSVRGLTGTVVAAPLAVLPEVLGATTR